VISPGNLAVGLPKEGKQVQVSEVSREQEYIRAMYERVDVLRRHALARLALALREDGGTAQSRLDRDATVLRHTEQLARVDAAQDGLCFGRLDLRTGERRHIGRIGLREESGEGEPLLIDWRAPAARAFYVATAGAPHGVRRRRHITMRGRRVTGLDDEVLDRENLAGISGLTGEAALLAVLDATRTGRMRDIVGTGTTGRIRPGRPGHRRRLRRLQRRGAQRGRPAGCRGTGRTLRGAHHRTMAERAAADRTWAFGHVIVDEAQELSEMAWRLLARRCPARSMTIVGDTAQTGGPAGTTSCARVLEPLAGDRWRLARLTVNYRTPPRSWRPPRTS
jgi:DNA helicase IV